MKENLLHEIVMFTLEWLAYISSLFLYTHSNNSDVFKGHYLFNMTLSLPWLVVSITLISYIEKYIIKRSLKSMARIMKS